MSKYGIFEKGGVSRMFVANELAEANRLKRLEMSKLYPNLPRELDELEDQA